MKEYPMDLIEFEKMFNTEEQCQKYLYDLRWADGYKCPKCNHDKAWQLNEVKYKCQNCGYQTSVIAGTLFQDTHKPLTLWFRAIWYITSQKNGTSALGLQRVLGLGNYRTAWTWLHKLRHAMVRPGRDKLKGVVEVDETYIGGAGSGGKRGRGAENKILTLVAVEINDEKPGRIRISIADNASSKNLYAFIEDVVESGSTIKSDGWLGYKGIAEKGFIHIIDTSVKDIDDGLLPHVHLVISLLQRWLLGTLQGSYSREHIKYYYDEFTFRFNRRNSNSRGMLFYRLLQNAVQLQPVTYTDIVNVK